MLELLHGLLISSIVHQRKSKKKVAEEKIAPKVERFLELRDCFLWPAAPGKDLAMYRIDDEGEGVRFLRAPDHGQRFVVPPQILQEFRIPLQSGSVSRVNDQRPAKLSLGTVKIPIKVFEDLTHGDMTLGKRRIQFESLRCCRARLGRTFCLRNREVIKERHVIAVRKARVGEGATGIPVKGLLKIARGLVHAPGSPLIPVKASAEVGRA